MSTGICQGDSGGPLFILEDKNFIITGRTTHMIKVGILTRSSRTTHKIQSRTTHLVKV